MPEFCAFEHERVPEIEHAAVAAEEMLMLLHGSRGQGRGLVVTCRSETDETGRYVEGTIAPFYMHAGEKTHLFSVNVVEMAPSESDEPAVQHRINSRLWLKPAMNGYDRSKLVVGKGEPASDEEQLLVAEFLGVATAAYDEMKATKAEQAAAAEQTPRIRSLLGRLSLRRGLRRAA